jgi:hypothetical protein
MPRSLHIAAAAAVALALAWVPAAAQANTSQEAMFQDDAQLVYPGIVKVGQNLDMLQSLGVDRVRVTLFWRLVAVNPGDKRKPSGDFSDPAAYPAVNWKRYDQLIRAANERGMFVNLNISGPAPDWAMPGGGSKDFPLAYKPNTSEWAKFVTAAARRYDGTYQPPNPNPPPPPPKNPNPLSLESLFPPSQSTQAATPLPEPALPRVSYWSIWNEPNQPTFLTPQNENGREASPRVYRGLLDTAFQALAATGHGGDTILIGETAPRGRRVKLIDSTMSPMRFIRGLYCVDGNLRFVRGAQASALGCPTNIQGTHAFPATHPALFANSGYAHHPYSLLTPPFVRSDDADNVGVADLPRITNTLDGIFNRYGQRKRMSLYITEFGYQSKPPDPYGYPQFVAAAFINQSEYIAYRNPRVRSYQQFLLRDDDPLPGYPKGSPAYWSTFQTGLLDNNGNPKQSFAAYRIPLWVVPATRRSAGNVEVWGAARPAPNFSRQQMQVQFQPSLRKTQWYVAKTVTFTSTRNYMDTHVRIPLSGFVRLAWRSPGGATLYSRPQFVSIG